MQCTLLLGSKLAGEDTWAGSAGAIGGCAHAANGAIKIATGPVSQAAQVFGAIIRAMMPCAAACVERHQTQMARRQGKPPGHGLTGRSGGGNFSA